MKKYTVIFAVPAKDGVKNSVYTSIQSKVYTCEDEEGALERKLLNEGVLFRAVYAFEGEPTIVPINYSMFSNLAAKQ